LGIKKLALNLVLGAALVIAPLSASALTPMSDNSMKDVTGQAGVSIGLDDIVIYQSIGETRYTDGDGWGSTSEFGPNNDSEAGSIVISEKEVLKQFNAILNDDVYGASHTIGINGQTFGDYNVGIVASGTQTQVGTIQVPVDADNDGVQDVDVNGDPIFADQAVMTSEIANPADGTTLGQAGGANTTGISPLTIDIGTCAALTAGYNYNAGHEGTANAGTIAGVIIGLPTIEIKTTGDTYSVGVAQDGAVNDGHNFITISKQDATMAILGGRLEIAAH
jgi:hypothetical protein